MKRFDFTRFDECLRSVFRWAATYSHLASLQGVREAMLACRREITRLENALAETRTDRDQLLAKLQQRQAV